MQASGFHVLDHSPSIILAAVRTQSAGRSQGVARKRRRLSVVTQLTFFNVLNSLFGAEAYVQVNTHAGFVVLFFCCLVVNRCGASSLLACVVFDN